MNSFLFHHLGLWLQSSASQQVQLQARIHDTSWRPSIGRQMISSYQVTSTDLPFRLSLCCWIGTSCFETCAPLLCGSRWTCHSLPTSQTWGAKTASHGVSWYMNDHMIREFCDAFKEIWAYSPIEWARWFAKNFATPKDIERTESWQHLRQVHSQLNIKNVWPCLTLTSPDILLFWELLNFYQKSGKIDQVIWWRKRWALEIHCWNPTGRYAHGGQSGRCLCSASGLRPLCVGLSARSDLAFGVQLKVPKRTANGGSWLFESFYESWGFIVRIYIVYICLYSIMCI